MTLAKRRIWAIGLIAVLVAACGGGGASVAPSIGPTGGASGSLEAASPSAALSGELTVWAMGTEGEKLPDLAKDFTDANPGVTVNVTAVDWGAAYDKLLTAIAARQTPDVSMIGTTWMGGFAQAGAFEELPGTFDKSAFFEGAFNTTVVGDKAYGVPWYVETRMIYYRTDLTEAAGITAPPASWDDLKAMAKALQEKGGAKWGINLQPGGQGSWQTYMPFVWSNGGDILGPDGTFALNSPQAVEALTYYQSFFKEGLSPTEATDLVPDFKAGRVGMFISGPWFIGILNEQAPELEGKWTVAPMPTKVTATSFVGGSDLAVFTDAKNKDLAWAFVSFLSDPATQAKWYTISADLPAVEDAWNDPSLQADPLIVAFGRQLNDAKAPPALPKWEEIAASAIDPEVEQVTKAGKDAQAAANDMQTKAESIGTGP